MPPPQDPNMIDPNTLLTIAAGQTMKGLEQKEDYFVPR